MSINLNKLRKNGLCKARINEIVDSVIVQGDAPSEEDNMKVINDIVYSDVAHKYSISRFSARRIVGAFEHDLKSLYGALDELGYTGSKLDRMIGSCTDDELLLYRVESELDQKGPAMDFSYLNRGQNLAKVYGAPLSKTEKKGHYDILDLEEVGEHIEPIRFHSDES